MFLETKKNSAEVLCDINPLICYYMLDNYIMGKEMSSGNRDLALQKGF